LAENSTVELEKDSSREQSSAGGSWAICTTPILSETEVRRSRSPATFRFRRAATSGAWGFHASSSAIAVIEMTPATERSMNLKQSGTSARLSGAPPEGTQESVQASPRHRSRVQPPPADVTSTESPRSTAV
jgi:hypothetical protein